jgi:hypothetical protein
MISTGKYLLLSADYDLSHKNEFDSFLMEDNLKPGRRGNAVELESNRKNII